MFKIEKGVPYLSHGNSKYPFEHMEVGDSFAVGLEASASARRSASVYGPRHNMKFMTRTLPDGSVRIWRIA